MRVAISCSIRSGSRASWKQPVKRSTKPMARSVAPSSRAPASDVIAPPVNEATTERPSTGAKTSCSGLHCVGIGEFLWPEPSRCSTTTLTYPEPRCTSACEIYGLGLRLVLRAHEDPPSLDLLKPSLAVRAFINDDCVRAMRSLDAQS